MSTVSDTNISALKTYITQLETDLATAKSALTTEQSAHATDKAALVAAQASVVDLTAKLATANALIAKLQGTVTPPVTPPPAIPTFIATATSATTVDVTWTNMTPTLLGRDGTDSSGYGAWDTSSEGFGGVPAAAITAKKFSFTSLKPGTTYLFNATSNVGNFKMSATTQGTVVPPVVPPVTPPVVPPVTGAPRLANRLLQGWFRWNDASAIPVFEAREGVPLDVFHLSVDGNDPQPVTLTTYGHCVDWVNGAPGRLLVMNWNWMTEAPGDFTNGNIDAKAVEVAQFIQGLGIADKVIIRPGYEMNAFWMPWGDAYAGNYNGNAFKSMWRRVIPKMKAVAPTLRVTWCVNPGTPGAAYDPANPNGASADPELFYPGDDVVDFIGIDQYFWWGTGNNWQGFLNTPRGIKWCAQFAQAHNKPWGIEETANVAPSAGTQGGGDVPSNFTQLLDWCNNPDAGIPASYVLYEDVPDGGVGCTMDDLPLTAAAWGNWFKTHR